MIVVTGVHRSGTSAIAMTLEALGLDFGDHNAFYEPDQWNERGYFERKDVLDLNSRLLTGFPRTGGAASRLASQLLYVVGTPRRSLLRRAARLRGEMDALATALGDMAVKDPRFCLTAEVWQEHITASVVCLRHPAEVASSLQRRQRVPERVGMAFWNRHAEALLRLPVERTHYVDFDALTRDDTEAELSRLLEFFDLDMPLERALEAFHERFSPRLRHFRGGEEQPLPDRTAELWQRLVARRDGARWPQ